MRSNEKPKAGQEPRPAREPEPRAEQAQAGAADNAQAEAGAAASDTDAQTKDLTFAEQVKKIAYAAAGAVNLSQDDIKTFVGRLVEQGELAQQEGRKIVDELGGRVRGAAGQAEDALKTLAERISKREEEREAQAETDPAVAALTARINASIERVLQAMHIASAKQIEELSRQVDELDRKLNLVVEKAGLVEPTNTH